MVAKSREKVRKLLDFVRESDLSKRELEKFYSEFKKQVERVEPEAISIPVELFSSGLSPLEVVAKYLHENRRLNFERIAKLVNRSSKTIWQAYNDAAKKHSRRFVVKSLEITISVLCFANRKFSILENLVVYLKEEHGMKYSDIAQMLNRNQRTIWTVYNRVQKKRLNAKN